MAFAASKSLCAPGLFAGRAPTWMTEAGGVRVSWGGELCSLQRTEGEIKPPKDQFTFQQHWRCPGFSGSQMRVASPQAPAPPPPAMAPGNIAAKSFSSHLVALHPASKTLSEPERCIKQCFRRTLTIQILTAGEPESE